MIVMIKRMRMYAKVTGYELGEDNTPKLVEHIVEGGYKSADKVKTRAAREWKGFMPTEVEFHRQDTTMSDAEYFRNATFGEDRVVTYPDSEKPAEDDSTDNDNK